MTMNKQQVCEALRTALDCMEENVFHTIGVSLRSGERSIALLRTLTERIERGKLWPDWEDEKVRLVIDWDSHTDTEMRPTPLTDALVKMVNQQQFLPEWHRYVALAHALINHAQKLERSRDELWEKIRPRKRATKDAKEQLP